MKPGPELTDWTKGSAKETFDVLYVKYWERLFSFAHRFSGSDALAEDIVQEVFFSLWQRRGSIAIGHMEAYLFQSVKYQLFRAYKNKEFPTDNIERDFEEYLITQASDEGTDRWELVKRLVEQLPEKRKEILYLSKFQNLSNAEIAQELNLSSQTVKNQLGKAIRSLRMLLKESGQTHHIQEDR